MSKKNTESTCNSESASSDLLGVGDRIRFDYFGKKEEGVIMDIGKNGYWIDSSKGCYGTAYIKCPFKLAKEKEEECPLCGTLIDITGLFKYEAVYCENCDTDLEWTGNGLIEQSS